MTWDNFDGSKRVHLDIRPEDKPFTQVKVEQEIADLIRKIHKDHPQWGAERIAAHTRHTEGMTPVTYDEVRSVLTPKE